MKKLFGDFDLLLNFKTGVLTVKNAKESQKITLKDSERCFIHAIILQALERETQ